MPASPYYATADSTVSAIDAATVTPSDTTVLPVTRALYIGAGGSIAVLTAKGTAVTFSGLNSGAILPVQVTKVLATGTTAGGILALY